MGKASLKWPSTKGWIKKSDVYVSRSRSSGSSRSYEFTVEYAYDVNGTTFTNNLYSYQVTYNAAHSKGAQELVSKYPEGSTVDVYYDPAKPENSVLLPGINLWSYLPYVAAIAFLAFGIFIYWDASKT